MAVSLQALLKAMTDKSASDLHITAGSPPRLRIDSELVRLQTEPLARTPLGKISRKALREPFWAAGGQRVGGT